MNYSLADLENLFDRIKNIINYVEKCYVDNNESLLMLANGDTIQVKIPKEKIAHLLGINIPYLKSLGIFNSESSFALLKELVDNAYKINGLRQQGLINYSLLFSDHIDNKINIFIDNVKINVRETAFVCKYDSERTYLSSIKNQKYDYIIVRTNCEGKKMALCLVRDGNNSYYVPMSSQIFDSKEEYEKFLEENINNQEITLLRQTNVRNIYNDYFKKFYILTDDILLKLNYLKMLKSNYNAIIDTSGALEFYLNQSSERSVKEANNTEIVTDIISSICNNELVDVDDIEDGNIKKIAEAYNDLIAYNYDGSTGTSLSYSKLLDEYKLIKRELEEIKSKNSNLEEEKTVLEEEKSVILKENEEYKKKEEEIINILKRKP